MKDKGFFELSQELLIHLTFTKQKILFSNTVSKTHSRADMTNNVCDVSDKQLFFNLYFISDETVCKLKQ